MFYFETFTVIGTKESTSGSIEQGAHSVMRLLLVAGGPIDCRTVLVARPHGGSIVIVQRRVLATRGNLQKIISPLTQTVRKLLIMMDNSKLSLNAQYPSP